jgi:hypothetical protein
MSDILSKLLSERTPLRAVFKSPSGMHFRIPVFVHSVTNAKGLIFSISGPPLDAHLGLINIRHFDPECTFWYGETRELPEEIRQEISGPDIESVLVVRFRDPEEVFTLFFTI